MGKRELAIISGIEHADPRVEQLHRVNARLDLRVQVISNDRSQPLAEAMPRIRVAVHQRFGAREVVRVAALDRIRREGKRRSRKPDQRNTTCKLVLDQLDGLEDVGQRNPGVERLQTVDVGGRADGVLDLRAFALNEIEGKSHRLERQQQIGKQDGCVHLDAADRLQSDFCGEIGRSTDLEQRMSLAQRPVLRHVAPRLSHEPDRALRQLALAGTPSENETRPRVVSLGRGCRADRARGSTSSSSQSGL